MSPLLSNILLDELDKELERRGHRFCRYADNANIYVKSKGAGERVFASIEEFPNKRLKLRVNQEKSAGLSGVWVYIWKVPKDQTGREVSGEVPRTGSGDDPAIPRSEAGTGHRGSAGIFAGMDRIFSLDRDSDGPTRLG